jgi:hypothetical protein
VCLCVRVCVRAFAGRVCVRARAHGGGGGDHYHRHHNRQKQETKNTRTHARTHTHAHHTRTRVHARTHAHTRKHTSTRARTHEPTCCGESASPCSMKLGSGTAVTSASDASCAMRRIQTSWRRAKLEDGPCSSATNSGGHLVSPSPASMDACIRSRSWWRHQSCFVVGFARVFGRAGARHKGVRRGR